MQTDRWININNDNNRFKLICNNNNCKLSICNLLNGKIHITTIHDGIRHSITFSNNDMIFIVSQFISSLNEEDKYKLLNFYAKNNLNNNENNS